MNEKIPLKSVLRKTAKSLKESTGKTYQQCLDIACQNYGLRSYFEYVQRAKSRSS